MVKKEKDNCCWELLKEEEEEVEIELVDLTIIKRLKKFRTRRRAHKRKLCIKLNNNTCLIGCRFIIIAVSSEISYAEDSVVGSRVGFPHMI